MTPSDDMKLKEYLLPHAQLYTDAGRRPRTDIDSIFYKIFFKCMYYMYNCVAAYVYLSYAKIYQRNTLELSL